MHGEGDLHDRALGAAVAYAVDVKDAVIVVAAGNVGRAAIARSRTSPKPARRPEPTGSRISSSAPAWYDDYVLTVGSVGADGSPSSFSLTGPWVDVAAPGEAVVSLDPAGTGLVNNIAAGAARDLGDQLCSADRQSASRRSCGPDSPNSRHGR